MTAPDIRAESSGAPIVRVAIATSDRIDAWRRRSVEALVTVPGVAITSWLRDGSDGAPDADLSSVIGLEPVRVDRSTTSWHPDLAIDVLLDLTDSGNTVPAGLASETWRFGFGAALGADLPAVALRDYVRGPGMTRIALLREDDGTVLREGRIQTVSYWHPEDLDRILSTPAEWPAAVVRARASGASADVPQVDPVMPAQAKPGRRIPGGLLRFAAVGRRAIGVLDSIAHNDEWHIGLVDAPIESMLTTGDRAPVTWLPFRPGHFAADPFGVELDGVLHVLYEDFDQRRGIGAIHHLSIGADGSVSGPEPVLELDVHLSYPFLIEHEGAVYMLPEASGSGGLVLYRAFDFPRDWRPVATLLANVPAVDASIVQAFGHWWLFADRADRGVNHDLFIWHADDLLGPWWPHAGNPVKTDARSSRPGGTPFVHDGILYRPSQDVSRIYGGRLIINQVDVLTSTAFAEHPVKAIEPRPGSPFPDGLHTLSRAGERTLIDGNLRHFVPDVFRSRFGR